MKNLLSVRFVRSALPALVHHWFSQICPDRHHPGSPQSPCSATDVKPRASLNRLTPLARHWQRLWTCASRLHALTSCIAIGFVAGCSTVPSQPSTDVGIPVAVVIAPEPVQQSSEEVIVEPLIQVDEPILKGLSEPSFSTTNHAMARFCQGDLSVFGLSERDNRRLYSICTAWYSGSDVPMVSSANMPNGQDWEDSCKILFDGIGNTEKVFLNKSLALTSSRDTAIPLCYFAILDRDKDGINDFQITNHGRFIENDVDVDNDGIVNVRDTDTVDETLGTEVSCGITAQLPDHLNQFCLQSPNSTACQLQTKLFNEYDMVVLNKDLKAEASVFETSLQSVYDAANIYQQGMKEHSGRRRAGNCDGLFTMQTVVFEQCQLERKRPWSSDDLKCTSEGIDKTLAAAQAHNGRFTIFPSGAALKPIYKIGTWVHEFGHLWDFAYDISNQGDTKELVTENLWVTPNFEKELQASGWNLPKYSTRTTQRHRKKFEKVISTAAEIELYNPKKLSLNGVKMSVLKELVLYEGLVTSDFMMEQGIFSEYSLSSIWEWHADAFMAYLYLAMENHIKERTDGPSKQRLTGDFIAWFRAHILEESVNRLYHPNMSKKLYERLQKMIPIESKVLDEMVCRYLINDDFVFDTLKHDSTFPAYVKKPHPSLKEDMHNRWNPICNRLTPSS